MNTGGLTEIVILAVGLQLHIPDQPVYSLMIVTAVVTTIMAGPLLHILYPEPFVARDIADAQRAALGAAARHRIPGIREASDDLVQWFQDLDRSRLIRQR